MKSIVFAAIMGLFSLFSCTSNWRWEHLDIAPLLHDHNSKIWLVDKLTDVGKRDYPLRKIEKMVLVFYSTGRYAFCPVTNLGEEYLEKGRYEVNAGLNELILITDRGIKRRFSIVFKNERILFKGLSKEQKTQQIELIPFPEF